MDPSLKEDTKIKVDKDKAKDLPTFSGYIVSKEHKPDNCASEGKAKIYRCRKRQGGNAHNPVNQGGCVQKDWRG